MNYQTYLNDLFAATSLPVCCFAPDGRERALLLPSRFADKAAFAERQREAAHAFARNTGDPLFLTGAQSTGGLRLPDLSVVLIGPAQRPGRQKVRQ